MKLIELLESKGYSVYLLASRTGISESTIYTFIKRGSSIKSMKFQNAYLIAQELGITLEELYKVVD